MMISIRVTLDITLAVEKPKEQGISDGRSC